VNPDTLWLLIPTIAAVSLTPGMCMSLAFSLGLSVGYRRTLFMMVGELLGVASVVTLSVLILRGVLSIDAAVFQVLSVVGACYLRCLLLSGQSNLGAVFDDDRRTAGHFAQGSVFRISPATVRHFLRK
jgi:threonine/homoserine/homoserine lactone efflux protein